ncbi:MAG: efflux RND transporter periplasmic adaptor subunit, partial [Gammaproteobacteria bacterium]|nr:efflux RND transporter periplasmic adaptor subunit [Gammaproteobacteria bacterium]
MDKKDALNALKIDRDAPAPPAGRRRWWIGGMLAAVVVAASVITWWAFRPGAVPVQTLTVAVQ